MFGEKPVEEYAVVINGADKKIFFPEPKKQWNRSNIKFVTTGNFRDVTMLEPLIMALDLIEHEENFELYVIGPVIEQLQSLLDRKYVCHHAEMQHEDLADLLRQTDVFLYSHLNPPCPNSVIEAISCGLPVVSFDSGSMKELLPWSTELLAPVSEDLFQRYTDFNYRKLSVKMRFTIENYQEYRLRALDNSNKYPFDLCAERYVELLEKLDSKKKIINGFTAGYLAGTAAA